MEIVVRGRHVDVSERFRTHVGEKLARADRFGLPVDRVDVEVSYEPNPRQAERAYKVEMTCRGTKPVIRAEAVGPDKLSALDIAWGRLEELMRRVSDKRRDHHKRVPAGMTEPGKEPLAEALVAPAEAAPAEAAAAGEADAEFEAAPVTLPDDDSVWQEGPIVVRRKEFTAAPMSVAQAVEAMELVGHDFYLFIEVETSTPAVVYRRRGFNYGLLRLDGGSAGGSPNA